VQVPSGPPISNLTAISITKVDEIALSTPTFQFNRSEFPVRSVGATRSVWARETAGANPAALTNLNAQSDNSNLSGCYPEYVGAIPA
jgi:hypothetical protein